MDDNTNTDNQEPEGISRRSVLAKATALGRAEGTGSNSRPGLYLLTVEGAKHRVISREDVAAMVQNFSKGHAEKQGLGWTKMASEAQQVSKLNTAIYLGELTHVDGLDVAQRASRALINARSAADAKAADFLSPFDALVNVARAQVNVSPDTPLSDEQIAMLIRKPDQQDVPIEADRLDKIATLIDKLAGDEKEPVSPETMEILEDALGKMMARVKELGGTSKDKREAEREAKKNAKVRANYIKTFGNVQPLVPAGSLVRDAA
jgi:predicted house-cleaning noncanonical NTP pyrophosphatase (MazG superfamily)